MTISLVFLTALMLACGAWLLRQSLFVQPWVAESGETLQSRHLPRAVTAPRLGLAVFLAVATSLFALTISAYIMHMAEASEWQFLPFPDLLWGNTGVLLAGSIALQYAWGVAKRDHSLALRLGLIGAVVCSLIFILGQYLVWRELSAVGYYMGGNPASAFFVLMTSLHGLHLLGGVMVLAWTLIRMKRGASPVQVREAVALCAVYWHYLLVVWGVLFGVLFVGAVPLYALCR